MNLEINFSEVFLLSIMYSMFLSISCKPHHGKDIIIITGGGGGGGGGGHHHHHEGGGSQIGFNYI